MKRITIGILAHVDSGKTTLSEAILYQSGVIRKVGRVDHGDAYLDSDSIERDRGITIYSSQAVFSHGDIEFTLLDTPGHIDFSPEMERTLKILDYAVLVVSGSDGIQSHTETLWQLLTSYRIPVFLFVNKMDLPNEGRAAILSSLQKEFSTGCIDFTHTPDEEELALCGENLLEAFSDGQKITDSMIRDAIVSRTVFPVAFGSALRGDGVDIFLNLLAKYVKEPKRRKTFGAVVYKITQDENGDRLTHLKITGGSLQVRDSLIGRTPDGVEWNEKISSIRICSGAKYKTVGEAGTGCVCTLSGLTKTYPGEGLGCEPDAGAAHLEPVLSYRVILPAGTDTHTALTLFRRLEEEEPELHIDYHSTIGDENGEIRFRIMGEVQLEVLKRKIAERYHLDVGFADGGIAYKESVRASTVGIGHYEPLRHYAEVQLLLEPAERGSGLVFSSDVSENDLAVNWQRLILTHLTEKTHIGALVGAPITDMKITLIAGRAHLKHTEGGDFRQATYRAVRQGLRTAQKDGCAVLLEPWYDFTLTVPSEAVGRAMTDITAMSGHFDFPNDNGTVAVLNGYAPVSEMRDYHRKLIGYTHGLGKLVCRIRGWDECHNSDEVIAAFDYRADSDVENSADSIFCANGAGYVVNWEEVPSHKHIDAGIELGEDNDETSEERVERYLHNVATDAELMAIFEQTYGAIKKRTFTEPKTGTEIRGESTKYASPSKNIGKNQLFGRSAVSTAHLSRTGYSHTGREYLLIDGYNIIFAWDELKKLSECSLDMARNELIKRFCNFQAFRQISVIIVFDAYRVKGNTGEVENHHGLSVVYTREAETADSYIEKTSHKLARDNRVRVATSDGQEQLIILGNGAIRLPATALHAELLEAERQIQSYLT